MSTSLFLTTALCALAAVACAAPLLPSGLVRTPSGIFPADCVHSVPSGATLERNPTTGRLHVHLADGTLHAVLPKCQHGARGSLPSDYDGWEACVHPLAHPLLMILLRVWRDACQRMVTSPFQIHCLQ